MSLLKRGVQKCGLSIVLIPRSALLDNEITLRGAILLGRARFVVQFGKLENLLQLALEEFFEG